MDNDEFVARLTVIERAIVNLAALAAQLRVDLLDEPTTDVVGSSHEPETMWSHVPGAIDRDTYAEIVNRKVK